MCEKKFLLLLILVASSCSTKKSPVIHFSSSTQCSAKFRVKAQSSSIKQNGYIKFIYDKKEASASLTFLDILKSPVAILEMSDLGLKIKPPHFNSEDIARWSKIIKSGPWKSLIGFLMNQPIKAPKVILLAQNGTHLTDWSWSEWQASCSENNNKRSCKVIADKMLIEFDFPLIECSSPL